MKRLNLFMDYGGVLAEYIFNEQTLERAHKFASQSYSLPIEKLRDTHRAVISQYLINREKTSEEWALEKIFAKVSHQLNRTDIPLERLCAIYRQLDHDERIYPAVFHALSRISDIARLHIISNLPHNSLVKTLKESNKLGMFATITLSCNAGYRKPHPEIYEIALRNANASKEDSIFISHDQSDLKGASNAGLPSILVMPSTFSILEDFGK